MNIPKFAYIEIERTKGASVVQNNGIGSEYLDKLLLEALPTGSPTDKFYKVLRINNYVYLSILHILDEKDYGLCLVIELTDDLAMKNPIGFVDSSYDHLIKVINQKNDLTASLNLTYKNITPEFNDYKDFDTIIFALLTLQKIVIVGESQNMQTLMSTIFECIPPSLRGHISFAANMTNISNDEKVSLVPISERVLKALDSRKEDYNVLLLPLNTAYGTYSSPICKKIAQLYKEEKCENIKEEIGHLFKLANESKELEVIADFAATHDLSIADASLIMWIRANQFDLEMEKTILESL
jgi:hypothetical protein